MPKGIKGFQKGNFFGNRFNSGYTPWNKGLTKKTDKRLKKMSKEKEGKKPWNKGISNPNVKGKNNPNWRGGKSSEIYGLDWTQTLKRSIRERDNYICQMPGCNKLQGGITHDIHHIDYDKENNNPNNLITLCKSCHMKTNYNRSYWEKYFINMISATDGGA